MYISESHKGHQEFSKNPKSPCKKKTVFLAEKLHHPDEKDYTVLLTTKGLIFLFLLALDIGSHWFQMYSTFLLGKTSHKDVKDSTSWLFRAYYGNRMFMGFCCVSCEVLYIVLFLLAETQIESLLLVLVVRRSWIMAGVLGLVGFGWGTKQLLNLIQMKTAADICVLHDINKKKKL